MWVATFGIKHTLAVQKSNDALTEKQQQPRTIGISKNRDLLETKQMHGRCWDWGLSEVQAQRGAKTYSAF